MVVYHVNENCMTFMWKWKDKGVLSENEGLSLRVITVISLSWSCLLAARYFLWASREKKWKFLLRDSDFFLSFSSLDLFYGILLYYKTDDEEMVCCVEEREKKMLEMRKNLDLYCFKAFYTQVHYVFRYDTTCSWLDA